MYPVILEMLKSLKVLLVSFALLLQVCLAETIELKDSQGRTILAKPVELADGKLTILRDDGRRYTFSLEMLSAESQELVKKEFASTAKPEPVAAASEPNPTPSMALKVDLGFNAAPPPHIEVELFSSDTRRRHKLKVDPSANHIDMSNIEDGAYTISFESDAYAYQWHSLTVKNGRVRPAKLDLEFRKKRYVVMRYAINVNGRPELSGDDLYTGTAAFTDLKYGNPQHFMGWRLRQAEPGESKYGDNFYMQWKWMAGGGGACVQRRSFDGILNARNDKFRPDDIELKKGMVFTCKSSYSRTKNMHGKFEVIDVVDEPPSGMEVY